MDRRCSWLFVKIRAGCGLACFGLFGFSFSGISLGGFGFTGGFGLFGRRLFNDVRGVGSRRSCPVPFALGQRPGLAIFGADVSPRSGYGIA